MAYAFTLDVPGSIEIYEEIAAKLKTEKPRGLVAQIVHVRPEGGLRHTQVWETKAEFDQFQSERVNPVVAEVLAAHGVDATGGPVFTEVELVDTWIG